MSAVQRLRARARGVRTVRLLRHWYTMVSSLRPRLRRQLAFGPVQPAATRKRIFVPLIETAHYQSFQVLLIARLLQQRGHEVRVLLCDSMLHACEVRSVRMQIEDPCLNCRFTRTRAVPLFGLDVAVLGDYLTPARAAALRAEAERIVANYPERFEFLGMDLIPMVNDSVTRHYYGAIPDAVRANCASSAPAVSPPAC